MKNEKIVSIAVPDGYEIDKEKSTFEKIVFRALPDKGLPRSWEDMGLIRGYYTDGFSHVYPSNAPEPYTNVAYEGNRNTWPTKEEAEASIVLAQLCQLRDRYNGQTGMDGCSYSLQTPSAGSVGNHTNYLFRFKTAELRDKFMENFSDLIEKAKPLLG